MEQWNPTRGPESMARGSSSAAPVDAVDLDDAHSRAFFLRRKVAFFWINCETASQTPGLPDPQLQIQARRGYAPGIQAGNIDIYHNSKGGPSKRGHDV